MEKIGPPVWVGGGEKVNQRPAGRDKVGVFAMGAMSAGGTMLCYQAAQEFLLAERANLENRGENLGSWERRLIAVG